MVDRQWGPGWGHQALCLAETFGVTSGGQLTQFDVKRLSGSGLRRPPTPPALANEVYKRCILLTLPEVTGLEVSSQNSQMCKEKRFIIWWKRITQVSCSWINKVDVRTALTQGPSEKLLELFPVGKGQVEAGGA